MKYMSLMCAALVAGTTVMAQQRPDPDRPRPRDPRAQERARPGGDRDSARRPDRPAALTDEQRAKVQEVTSKTRDEQRQLAEKVRNLRQEMDELARTEQVDEAAVRAKGVEIGQAEAEMALIRGRHYQELKGVLTEEQLEAFGSRPGFPPGAPPAYGQRLERIERRAPDAPRAVPGRPVPPRRGESSRDRDSQ